MKKIAPIIILLAIAAIGYLDSPQFAEKEQAVTSFPLPEEEATSANTTEAEEPVILPELENQLVDLKQEDGYAVEVYREYEVYKDEKGNVIDRIPTENYHYLRYKESF